MMEISQSSVVRVRGARWGVVDIRAFDHCRILTLIGLGPTNHGLERRVLTPFDIVERVERRSLLTRAPRRTWRRACRALIAAETPPGGLQSARLARIDLHPHQLEPALAVVRGLGSRVLLADEVGLGKTIQAGLMVSELQAIGAADRVLILTPAGLRDQWCQEMSERLSIRAVIVDAQAIRRATETLPIGLSPRQTMPVAIASVDYIKRADVLAAAAACRWDVVIVDEAHGVAGDSDRHAAVAALATRASYVVLLTATPHSGDRQSFVSLCGIGAMAGDDLLVFRRSRQDVHLGSARRVHRLTVRPNADEVRMHARLADFSRAVRQERSSGRDTSGKTRANRTNRLNADVWLALSVLHKRALSSARSLQHSIARRLATLASGEDTDASQLLLPLGDLAGELTAADQAPEWSPILSLRNAVHERRLLDAVADAAAAAARHETKIHATIRLLRRLREPAIVFTEYRDTLLHLQASLGRPSAVLHGGLTREERRMAIDQFTSGTTHVLLATDAAGEGLNLQRTCRIVVNLELPWNPMRLEQRIGRVDRIGQRQTVHVFHLIASDSGESRMLARLQSRVALSRADVGGPDPLGVFSREVAVGARLDSDCDAARLVIAGETEDRAQADLPDLVQPAERLRTPRLTLDAELEAKRISACRRFVRIGDDEALATIECCGPSMTIAGHWRTRASLGSRALTVWRVGAEDGSGRAIGSQIVTLTIALPSGPRMTRRQIDDLLGRRHDDVMRCIEEAVTAWRHEVARVHRELIRTRLSRQRAIRAGQVLLDHARHQAGLFDRRAERAGMAILSAEQARHRARAEQHVTLDRIQPITFHAPQLLLVLIP